MSERQDGKKKKNGGVSGLAIPGGLLIGLGVGLLIDNIPAALFIGLGCGFLIMLAVRMKTGEW